MCGATALPRVRGSTREEVAHYVRVAAPAECKKLALLCADFMVIYPYKTQGPARVAISLIQHAIATQDVCSDDPRVRAVQPYSAALFEGFVCPVEIALLVLILQT